MRKLIAGGAVGAMTATLLAVAGVSPAVAATGDGTISVTVVKDVNVNKERDALDVALPDVDVRVYDAAGGSITVTTDPNGVATLTEAENTLVGGRYRIEVVNPSPATYSEAQISEEHAEPEFAPAVSFVDVRDGADAVLSIGYVDYSTLGVEGARIFSAVQPDDVWRPNSGSPEVYTVNYDLTGGVTALTSRSELGAVYGVGIDDENLDLYIGAYAKRGSLYGPGGSGAIYRVNTVSGDWETYATVANAGDTAHDMGPVVPGNGLVQQDYAFRTVVGRESLGDVEVTDDNRFITAVNLNEKSLVVYPVQDALDPQPIQTLNVPAPADCVSDWAPMGLAERGTSLFVGAVCGSDLRAFVLEYERASDGTLSTAPVSTREGDVSATVPRAGQTGPGFGVLGDCNLVDWREWTDTVPQNCVDDGLNVPAQGIGSQFVVPQPMLGDIEFLEDGQLILSFRDRGGDQYGSGLYLGNKTSGGPSYGMVVATGDIIALPADATSLDFANPVHDFNDNGAGHNQAAFSGITTVPGSGTIVGNAVDPSNVFNTNGLRSWDSTDGSYDRGVVVTTDFVKSMGLADVEALVLEQTQQIGNRIWSDLDQDGVQDANEGGIAGVQVGLYDADGELVATAVTDANGEYWFDTADGLLPDTEYEVRLDRPTDFEEGGPLSGYTATEYRVGTNRGIDSNGEVSDDGTIIASITTPAAGINDHSIDFGFVPTLVSVGDYVWFDADRDGAQDADETPISGVEVILYDSNGIEVARTTTDADGFYAFGDLVADTEYSIVFPTSVEVDGEQVPLTGADLGGDDAEDSDADPTTGRVTFTTTTDGDNSVLPGEVDLPTIDAGYAPPVLVSVGDYVWIDADRDGVQDATEAPIAGVEIILYDGEGVEIARTTTDADGYYVFTSLTPSADYTIQFPTTVIVDGTAYPLTQQGVGDDRAADSNPGTDGRYSFTTPATGDNSATPGEADDPTIDVGYLIPSVSVGDFVWLDTDRDGVQEEGEPGIPGVTLTITGPDGEPVTDVFGDPVGPATTDENGSYSFVGLPVLPPGESYTVTVTPPDGFVPTLPGVGTGETDSSTGSAVSGDLTVDGARDDTLDFGFFPNPVSIGDYVWLDVDGDGVQDPGESPIAGIDVKLYDADGTLVASTTTDENGFYVFTDLLPNTDYFLEFPTTVEIDGQQYALTPPGQGGAGVDSNADQTTGRVPVTTPATGRNSALPGEVDDPTYDVGYTLNPVIVTPTPTPVPTGLPATGSGDVLPLVALAMILLLAGAGVVIARRSAAQQ
ncbi:SdrD B-like domain-containing protein [Microbacterium sp. ZW T5_45]|uniref:SdrD B-like domain-containing protein n=1 Tax=Microbacterium sp. ZW T5_45 TaxID=3378080 RepID=UPI0038529E12